MAGLGRVVRRVEALRADRGLRPADVIGADAGERHRPPFAYGTGLRVVDEDARKIQVLSDERPLKAQMPWITPSQVSCTTSSATARIREVEASHAA